MTVKLSDAAKGFRALVYWTYYLSQIRRCLKWRAANQEVVWTAAGSSQLPSLNLLSNIWWDFNIYSLSRKSGKVGHSSRPYTTGILIPQSASAMVSGSHYQWSKEKTREVVVLPLMEGTLVLFFISHLSRCQSQFKIRLPPGWWRWNSYMKLKTSVWTYCKVGESCPVKACLSYVVGGAMGAFMGLFQVDWFWEWNITLISSPASLPIIQHIRWLPRRHY